MPNCRREKCVFPFVYNGNTYDSYTISESVNGLAWCATSVDRSRKAEAWEDCKPGCPGYYEEFWPLIDYEYHEYDYEEIFYEEIWPQIDFEEIDSVRLVEEKFLEVF